MSHSTTDNAKDPSKYPLPPSPSPWRRALSLVAVPSIHRSSSTAKRDKDKDGQPQPQSPRAQGRARTRTPSIDEPASASASVLDRTAYRGDEGQGQLPPPLPRRERTMSMSASDSWHTPTSDLISAILSRSLNHPDGDDPSMPIPSIKRRPTAPAPSLDSSSPSGPPTPTLTLTPPSFGGGRFSFFPLPRRRGSLGRANSLPFPSDTTEASMINHYPSSSDAGSNGDRSVSFEDTSVEEMSVDTSVPRADGQEYEDQVAPAPAPAAFSGSSSGNSCSHHSIPNLDIQKSSKLEHRPPNAGTGDHTESTRPGEIDPSIWSPRDEVVYLPSIGGLHTHTRETQARVEDASDEDALFDSTVTHSNRVVNSQQGGDVRTSRPPDMDGENTGDAIDTPKPASVSPLDLSTAHGVGGIAQILPGSFPTPTRTPGSLSHSTFPFPCVPPTSGSSAIPDVRYASAPSSVPQVNAPGPAHIVPPSSPIRLPAPGPPQPQPIPIPPPPSFSPPASFPWPGSPGSLTPIVPIPAFVSPPFTPLYEAVSGNRGGDGSPSGPEARIVWLPLSPPVLPHAAPYPYARPPTHPRHEIPPSPSSNVSPGWTLGPPPQTPQASRGHRPAGVGSTATPQLRNAPARGSIPVPPAIPPWPRAPADADPFPILPQLLSGGGVAYLPLPPQSARGMDQTAPRSDTPNIATHGDHRPPDRPRAYTRASTDEYAHGHEALTQREASEQDKSEWEWDQVHNDPLGDVVLSSASGDRRWRISGYRFARDSGLIKQLCQLPSLAPTRPLSPTPASALARACAHGVPPHPESSPDPKITLSLPALPPTPFLREHVVTLFLSSILAQNEEFVSRLTRTEEYEAFLLLCDYFDSPHLTRKVVRHCTHAHAAGAAGWEMFVLSSKRGEVGMARASLRSMERSAWCPMRRIESTVAKDVEGLSAEWLLELVRCRFQHVGAGLYGEVPWEEVAERFDPARAVA